MMQSQFSRFIKNLQQVHFGAMIVAFALVTGFAAPVVQAQASVNDGVCDGLTAAGVACDSSGQTGDEIKPVIQTIVDILSIIVGAVSVIMIIIGGFRYVVSNGDSNGMAGAKNTILYAIVGLVIVIFAQVIVRFVYSTVNDGGASSSNPAGSTAPSPTEN